MTFIPQPTDFEKIDLPKKDPGFIFPGVNIDTEDLITDFQNIDLLSEKEKVSRRKILQLRDQMNDAARMLLDSVKHIQLPDPSKFAPTHKYALSAFFADDHIGKKCYLADSQEPIVTFDSNIAAKRIDYYIDQLMAKYYENPSLYDIIVLNLVGDHVEGDGAIYNTQWAELEFGINQQIQIFKDIIGKKIMMLAEMLKENKGHLMIKCVSGNHGENRKSFMVSPHSNFDYIIFQSLEWMIKTQYELGIHRNISIQYPDVNIIDRKFLKYNLKGWNFYLEHILPRNLLSDSTAGKIRSLDETMNGIDVILTGHYHSEVLATIGKTTIIRTASLPGFDEYAHSIKATMSESMHPIIVTSQEHKIKEYLPIFLGHIR